VSYSDGIITKSWLLQKKHNSLVDSRRRLADLTMSQRLGIEKKWMVVVVGGGGPGGGGGGGGGD
jgi:uncharacterized membrane protein